MKEGLKGGIIAHGNSPRKSEKACDFQMVIVFNGQPEGCNLTISAFRSAPALYYSGAF